MDLGKRKFLQNLGVLTAGTALVPMAEAGLHFSPTRREGDPSKRYGMLIDLRRCV
ncbi:tetrathionate reductase subunit B, partial [Salmonella enterica subsp. enterica serovar Hadar]|nr:tetrathionate reductase subunit B [Salmonella enterica subsp. enterica serovar Hadar]